MNKSNRNITFKGKKVTVLGNEVKEGQVAPPFKLVATDMTDLESSSFKGKVLVLSVNPSIDTPVCAVQAKRFNEEAAKLAQDVIILTVSLDLPFAQKRWCAAEGVERVQMASDYKYRSFGENYGTYIQELGLLARAVFVLDRGGKVTHVEYVSDVANEPDYDAAIRKVKEVV